MNRRHKRVDRAGAVRSLFRIEEYQSLYDAHLWRASQRDHVGAAPSLDDAQIDVDIIAYRVGVGANLVCLGDEGLGLRPVETG